MIKSSLFNTLIFSLLLAIVIYSKRSFQNPVQSNKIGSIIFSKYIQYRCNKPGQFAMTFDQGPSLFTGDLLDICKSEKVKVTFHPVITYLTNVTLMANLQAAANAGHTIGLSLEQSFNVQKMAMNDIMIGIDNRANLIRRITGFKPKLLTFPFVNGSNSYGLTDEQLGIIHEFGYIVTIPSIDSYDYQTNDPKKIANNIINVPKQLNNDTLGAYISLQRDTSNASVQATPMIIKYLKKKGYSLVTLDECLGINPYFNINQNQKGQPGSTTSNNNNNPVSSSSPPPPPPPPPVLRPSGNQGSLTPPDGHISRMTTSDGETVNYHSHKIIFSFFGLLLIILS